MHLDGYYRLSRLELSGIAHLKPCGSLLCFVLALNLSSLYFTLYLSRNSIKEVKLWLTDLQQKLKFHSQIVIVNQTMHCSVMS